MTKINTDTFPFYDVIGFAEWMNINAVRIGYENWHYNNDKLKNSYTTAEMFVFYKRDMEQSF